MAIKRYAVMLTEPERAQLKGLIATGTDTAARLQHARVLLKADQCSCGPAWTDERIAEAVEVSQPTVSRIRKQYVEDGLDAALNRRPSTRTYTHKLDGVQEAKLIALTCETPLAGQAKWSLRLLAEKLVELQVADVSYQTVRCTLNSHQFRSNRPLAHPNVTSSNQAVPVLNDDLRRICANAAPAGGMALAVSCIHGAVPAGSCAEVVPPRNA
jgi:transposase